MKKEDLKALNQLAELPLIAQRLSPQLMEPSVHKRFIENVNLLMGLHDIPACKVAKLAGCDATQLARMMSLKPSATKFERVNILTFVSIAKTLGVSVHTLLFVDLREKVLSLIAEVEE